MFRQEINVFAIESWGHVTGLFTAFQFGLIGGHDLLFHLLAALGVDRVRDVGVQFKPRHAVALVIFEVPAFVEPAAAVIAVAGAQVIFFTAAWAMIAELA